MNNNDDDFKENVEYMAPKEMPTGQILTPKAVIEASEDLMEYRQIINDRLMTRGCDTGLITIQLADLNNEAISQLTDEVKDAGWQVIMEDKNLYIQ